MQTYDDGPLGYEQQASPAAPARPKQRRGTGGIGRALSIGLLGVAFAASTVVGGVVGALVTVQVLGHGSTPAPIASIPALLTQTSAPPQAGSTLAASIYAAANPSVVQIAVGSASPRGGSGSGSGFVVDNRGYILTNQHVVQGAGSISVRFAGGETRTGQVVGSDRANDLALVKVDLPAGVRALPLGDTSTLAPGDLAVAIGSPFGLAGTVTQGIVSAVDRSWQPSNGPVRRNLIQTDAPINPGNSGGPLLNARGEVVGINAMIESPVQGSVGIGFAISVNVAKALLPQLETGANIEPVWMGVSGTTGDGGALLQSVILGGPASAAGLRAGDVITKIDGVGVRDVGDIARLITGKRVGDTIRVTYLRGGQEQTAQITLRAWPNS